ncbi:hypothetical protein ACNPQM_42250 [Streptomyces sp. NPDC056231]|uniref:hypothetical protein n=1 Tax=Streptomyces sp. NPDC056231 TaxID=3345755 RepID=UPI003AAE6F8F
MGELCSIGLWRAVGEAEFYEKVFGVLRLWPWMTAAITPVRPHPIDPGRAGGAT